MGVTYYKLEQRYEGDVTKGCGLTSAEVDANFHFLRGYDIKDAYLKNGLLTLERVNCDKIVVDGLTEYIKQIAGDAAGESFDLSGTTFDPETGILTIVVNGVPYEVAGLISEGTFRIYVGYGLDGQGTIADPVRISHIMDTGFYAPVERVIDYEQGEKLPDTAEGGDVAKRYITREGKSPYGLLYGYSAVRKIDEFLKNEHHGWRVPTFDDWAAMLNGQEECDGEYLNHGNKNESSKNGKLAGAKLKDISWNEEESGTGIFNVLPIYTKDYPIDGERLTAEFWASTVSSADTHVYGKRFEGGESTVETLGNEVTSNWLSLRLVRDAGWGNESETEVINGVPYETVSMPTYKVNEQGHVVLGTAVWTKENVSFDEYIVTNEAKYPVGPTFVIPDETAFTETVKWYYYINYYDAFDGKWVKKQLNENDIVMVHNFDDSHSDVEAIVRKDDEGNFYLKLRSEELFESVKEYVDESIAEEDAVIKATISALTEEINDELDGLKDADERIREDISGLTEDIENINGEIRRIDDTITTLSGAVSSGYTVLEDKINNVEDALEDEVKAREDNDVDWEQGPKTAYLGSVGTHGVGISSKGPSGQEKIVKINFDLDMGEITIEESE